ncbi:MAG: IS1634 family transposase [Holosporales bacterium]|jgi:transposase|nr:IS1634 family transposase [Holosporales bacterium]
MNLRKIYYKKTGRTFLTIVRSYREKGRKNPTAVTVRSLGYLDVLEKEFPDPIAHFEKVVEEMNKAEKETEQPNNITFYKNELSTGKEHLQKNLGYAALSKIYHELGLRMFLTNHTRNLKAEFNLNNILKILSFSRILEPCSKKRTYENREWFFENTDFSLDDVYRSLSVLNMLKDDILLHIHKKIKEQYNRSTELVYYDVTNYYFEIDEQDSLRKKGVSKEHRPNPIVQMGLFMDTKGVPLCYRLFEGNTNDCKTLIPILRDLKRDYDIGRTIVVADKGMNTADNIISLLLNRDGYIYSQTVRGAHKELKEYILDKKDYQWVNDDFKVKSRLYPRLISFKDKDGKKKSIRIDEKQVVFYNKDFDKKAKADRAATVIKAQDLVVNPSKYKQAISHGAAKYVENLNYDKDTGEIIVVGNQPMFDEEKLKEEEKYDGYYCIITSEYKKTDQEIIDLYHGLWKIEESFKVTKSDLKARPVYLSREDHIEAHFLICFIALTIARLLENRLDNKYSITKIAESLKKMTCINEGQNWYLLLYHDEITEIISEKMGIDMKHRRLTLGQIKNFLGATKKT